MTISIRHTLNIQVGQIYNIYIFNENMIDLDESRNYNNSSFSSQRACELLCYRINYKYAPYQTSGKII